MRRLLVTLVGVLIGLPAFAGLPQNFISTIVLTPSNIVDSRYRDGNDGTAALGLKWATIPTITGTQGTPQTVNLRSLYLTEPGGATLSTTCTPSIGGGWSTTTDGLSYTYSGAYSGICRTSATVSGKTALSKPYQLISVTTTGGDTTAPAKVLGVSATQTASGIHLSWFPSADPQVASQVRSGLKEYRIYRDGSGTALATVNAQSAGVAVQLAGVELGGTTGGSTVQNGNDYTVQSTGDGVGGTTELGHFAHFQVSGDFRLCGLLNSISGGNSSAHIALMARNTTLAGGDPTAFVRINPTSAKTRGRGTANTATVASGTTVNQGPPAYECISRTGNSWLSLLSVDGNSWTTVDSILAVALPSTVEAGIFVGTGGSTLTSGDVRGLILTNDAPLTYDDAITDGASHSYVVKAVDVSLNIGTGSASVSATAPATADTTPPAAPTGLTGSGPSSSTVSWTWTNPTDASGIRGCVPSWATTSGGTYTDQPEQVPTTFTLSGLSASTTRWLKVKCIDNAANVGAFSSPVSATSAAAPPVDTTPPTVPSGNSATGVNTTDFTIQTSGSTDSGCGVADYRLYASTASGGPFNLVATFTASPFTYHSAGPAGTTYYFKLTAQDCASPQNESAQSATFSGATTSASGGTLLYQETFDTLMAPCGGSCGYPFDPPYNASWNSVGAKTGTCIRSVVNSVSDGTGAVKFDFTPIDGNANHCMGTYKGSNANLIRGKEYWLGFETYLDGGWPENDSLNGGSGGWDILWQLHGDNSGTDTNPPVNLTANAGVGNPYGFTIQGDTDNNRPGAHFVSYPYTDASGQHGFCGNIVLHQWERWVIHVIDPTKTVDASGNITAIGPALTELYHGGISTPPTLCIHDTGLNDYVGDTNSLYWTIGLYHGSGNTGPAPEHIVYFDQIRYGRADQGVGLQDVVPR